MAYTFQGGSSETWPLYNRVLPTSVVGVETDTGKYKVGDNETRWKELEYSGGDVYPQFRVENEHLQVQTEEDGDWEELYTVLGHPGTKGSYRPGDGEGRFLYELLEGEVLGDPPDFPDGPSAETTVALSGDDLDFFQSYLGGAGDLYAKLADIQNAVAASGEKLNTVPPTPQSGTANASPTFSSPVLGVNISNDDDLNDLTFTVNGKVYLVRAGKALTVMDYGGISTFSVAGSDAWAAVGLETYVGVS